MSGPSAATQAALEKVLKGIEDPAFERRYPDRAHFIPADHPRHGAMASRALFAGDPVVLTYPDGRELLFVPEHVGALAALALLLLGRVLLRRRKDADVVRFPPRTHIEARDSGGTPIAA